MAATITRTTIPSQLLEGIHTNFGVGYAEADLKFLKFADQTTSSKDVERYQPLSGFGLHKKKPEGTDTEFDTVSQDTATIIANISYALGYKITHEELQDNLYKSILDQALDLGVSARQTKETVVLDRLNTGFSVAAADLLANGQSVFSLTQPLFGTGGETDQNRPTVAASLSEASLIIDVSNIRKFRGPAGKRIDARPRMLMVPVELEAIGWKLLNSEFSVGNDFNDLNPMRQQAAMGFFPDGVQSSPFLSSPTAYFIRTNIRGYQYQTREEPRIMEEVLIRAMVQQVISFQRFGVQVYDWRSVYGNPGV